MNLLLKVKICLFTWRRKLRYRDNTNPPPLCAHAHTHTHKKLFIFALLEKGKRKIFASAFHWSASVWLVQLLRERSMLYCICRKPYDQRKMIACDQCDEWYHFDCINLVSTPKVYICPACKPRQQDLSATPSVDLDR